MNIGDLIFSLLADGSRLEQDVTRQAQAAGDKAGTKAGTTLGQRMSASAGRALTGLGAAGGVVFAGAVESGAAFEDQLRTINTVAGLSDEELHGVGDSIQALSRETGKTTDDLTSGFYDLVSAGVDADDAIAVLRDSARFATGALGSTAESVDLVTSAMNAYGLKASDSTRITDIFAKAVQDGKVTAAELGGSIAQIAPIASNAGISLEEVSAGFAVLTAKGVPASEAATQMRSAIVGLLNPNEQLNKIQKETGINFAELARTEGLAASLEKLREVTGGNADAMTSALGRTEAYQFALASTGENAEAFATQIQETAETSGLALDQYNEKSKSSVEQGKRFAATLNTLAQDFGGAFSGAAPFLVTLNQLGPAFRGLISPAKIFGGLLGGGLAKGLQLLGGPFGKLGSKLGAKLAGGIATGVASSAASSIIADGLGDAVGSAIDGPGIKGKLSGPLGRLGKFMGSGLGKAFSVGFAAAAVVGVIETYNQVNEQTKAQNAQISKDVANQIKTGTDEQLRQTKAALETGISQLNGVWDAGLFTNESRDKLNADLAAVNAALETGAGRIPPSVSGELTAGKSEVTGAASDMVEGIPGEVDQAATDAGAAAQKVPAEIAQGILDKQFDVKDAMSAITGQMESELTRTQEIAQIIGFLTSKGLQEGLNDGRPGVRAIAEGMRSDAEARLAELVSGGRGIGKKGSAALADGLDSKSGDVKAAAKRVKNIVTGETGKIPGEAKRDGAGSAGGLASGLDSKRAAVRTAAARINSTVTAQIPSGSEGSRWGKGLGKSYADGLRSSKWWIAQAARNALAAAKAILATHSPPGPLSPLHDIDKWGAATFAAYAGGFHDEAGGFQDLVRSAVDVRVPGPEIGAPRIGGLRLPSIPGVSAAVASRVANSARASELMAAAGGDGGNLTINMPVQGALPVETTGDVVTMHRLISESGILPERFIPPKYPRHKRSHRR